MLAYKAFNVKLQATRGKGTFQFKPGKTYKEDSAKCASTGFHCAENPLSVFNYYYAENDRYFLVEAAGDINQDGQDTRIACTEITLLKELTKLQIITLGCKYMIEHPLLKNEFIVQDEEGICKSTDESVIVRGKRPHAKGQKGKYLFLLKEEKKSRNIKEFEVVLVDGEEYQEDTWYTLDHGEVITWNSRKANSGS